jgi:L-amino acid N-acyltransferase YncA
MTSIRPFQAQDWPALWPILHSVISAGDTFAFAPDSTEAEIRHAWIEVPQATFVALSDAGAIIGTSIIKPNQPGLGGHVCNCGYAVAQASRGQGVAALLCEHSQQQARALGYRAMQFNIVVSTNTAAVYLWQKLGFAIVGTLPEAFRHSRMGYVDAYVMHKSLIDVKTPVIIYPCFEQERPRSE